MEEDVLELLRAGVEEQRETTSCYRLAADATRGRHLVSTRPIPAGSLIMACEALVAGPKVVARAVCLGCCSPLESLQCRCSGCGWPLCSRPCEGAPLHLLECHALARAGFPLAAGADGISIEALYAAVTPLRCLKLPRLQLRAVRALQSHLQERLLSPAYSEQGLGVQRAAARFLHRTLGLPEEDVLTMAATLDTNAFDISRKDTSSRALYGLASLLSHDCQPNARCALLPASEAAGAEVSPPRLGVFAQRDIPPGSVLSISYYADSLRGPLQRRSHLRATKCFDCTCKRCADPRDLGLHMDSIRCIRCRAADRDSLLISTCPLDGEADWQCPECGFSLSADQMVLGHRRLRAQVTSLDLLAKGVVEAFLDEHLGPSGLLHPTSSHVLQIKYTLLTSVYGYRSPGYTFPEMSDLQLDLAWLLSAELLRLAEQVEPGLCILRGSILLAKHGVAWEKARRKALRGDSAGAQKDILISVEALREAERTLLDPDSKLELDERKRLLEMSALIDVASHATH